MGQIPIKKDNDAAGREGKRGATRLTPKRSSVQWMTEGPRFGSLVFFKLSGNSSMVVFFKEELATVLSDIVLDSDNLEGTFPDGAEPGVAIFDPFDDQRKRLGGIAIGVVEE